MFIIMTIYYVIVTDNKKKKTITYWLGRYFSKLHKIQKRRKNCIFAYMIKAFKMVWYEISIYILKTELINPYNWS